MKRSVCYFIVMAMLLGFAIPASAETVTLGEITTEPMLLTIESVMSLYDGDDADALRDFLSACLPEYEADGTSQEFLRLVAEKLRTEEIFDIIDIMNVRQVMAGLPEGPLPSDDGEEQEETIVLSVPGEIRAEKMGGISPRIAIGQEHTVYLTTDGSVYTWGKYYSGDSYVEINENGLLIALSDLSGVVDVAAGGGSALALKSDGTVWAWGKNEYGQLGNNSTTDSITPVQVQTAEGNLTNVTAIAMGYKNGAAITADGAVYTWGDNTYGQLGNNSTIQSLVAVRVVGVDNEGYLDGIKSISVGEGHILALTYNNTILAWGRGNNGQLGDGDFVNKMYPINVVTDDNFSNIKKVVAGGRHSLALTDNGVVLSWGSNNMGQLGIGSTVDSNVPITVSGIGGEMQLGFVTDITAGYEFSAARRSNGKVVAWGNNTYGQLGDGTTLNRNIPIENDALQMSWEVYAGKHHLIVKSANGRIYGSGRNNRFQLNDSYPARQITTFREIYSSNDRIVDISASSTTTLARLANGMVYGSGLNSSGQIGYNSTYSRTSTVKATLDPDGTNKIFNVIDVKSAGAQSFVVKADGSVWGWGANSEYQLGDGTTTQRLLPVQVKGVDGIGYLSDIISLDVSGPGYRAIRADGVVYEWGMYSTTQNIYPVEVEPEIETVVEDAIQVDGNLMLKKDGTVWTKGTNEYGQLGINKGTSYVSEDWEQVLGVGGTGHLTNIIQIASGLSNYALGADGTLYAWGNNQYGTCGDNSTTNRKVPVKVKGVNNSGYLSGVSRIVAGEVCAFAFLSDGTIAGWGSNYDGNLANESLNNQSNHPKLAMQGTINTDIHQNKSSSQNLNRVYANMWQYGVQDNLNDTDYFIYTHHGDEKVKVEANSYIYPNRSMSCVIYYIEGTKLKNPPFDSPTKTYTLEDGKDYIVQGGGRVSSTPYRFKLHVNMEEEVEGFGNDYGNGSGASDGNDFSDENYGSSIVDETFNYNKSITINDGAEYTFVLTANDAAGMPQSMTVEYDSEYFDVVTLCALVSEPVTTTGAVEGTGITITAASPGTVTFTRNITVTDGKSWDGAVNVIRLKAKKAGTTVVSCETGGQ